MVAYICPFCSNISSKLISVFNFSGADKLKLICPTHGCHETCVSITQKNEKYKIDIECPLCSERHTYTINRDNFWHKPLITYKCPVAGIDIFFAGERAKVEKVLDDNSEIYSDIVDEFSEEFRIGDDDTAFNLLYAIIEQLHKLKNSRKITCLCGETDIDLNVINGNIVLACPKCGRTKIIESNEETLTRLLNTNAVVLGR